MVLEEHKIAVIVTCTQWCNIVLGRIDLAFCSEGPF
jgi:hypothetical protein